MLGVCAKSVCAPRKMPTAKTSERNLPKTSFEVRQKNFAILEFRRIISVSYDVYHITRPGWLLLARCHLYLPVRNHESHSMFGVVCSDVTLEAAIHPFRITGIQV